MKRTALFFGSFNPIHVGHLVIANTMAQQDGIDEVWFVVSPQNPLKERSTLLADHHRLQMVRRAVDDNYHLRVCDIEMHLPIPSYTVVTLAALGEKYPDREFSLIMGSDNLATFERCLPVPYRDALLRAVRACGSGAILFFGTAQ